MIRISDLHIGNGRFALERISFQVPGQQYGVLMGKTGCGKTTILEAICGLKPVVSGKIELMGRDVTHVKPAERGIGYVPQDAAIFTTMTVRNQLAFALKVRRWQPKDIAQRVDELAELLSITHLLARKAQGLSGGELQRVALGRALSFRPDILLLDEPLSALDQDTKDQMYDLLKRAQQHEHVTALHVTHSREAAERLADRVLKLVDGQVVDLAVK